MEKLISIVITFKQEREQQLAVALSSINNQIGIDFDQVEVILINDGGAEIEQKTLVQFYDNLKIQYYRYGDNKGISFARMIGTEMAQGRYVMYLDADDQLQYVGALLDFFNAVRYQGDHEMIVGSYIEQTKTEHDFRYYRHDNHDQHSPAAKWFKQAYLEQIHLAWREDLQAFENDYFVTAACEIARDVVYLDTSVYTWCWHDKAVSRQDDGATLYKQLDQWARSHRCYFEKIKQYKPEILVSGYLDYMADIYLRAQLYPPLNMKSFQHEHQLLLKLFPDLWQQSRTQLTAEIQRMIEQRPEYHKFSTAGVTNFINSQDQLVNRSDITI